MFEGPTANKKAITDDQASYQDANSLYNGNGQEGNKQEEQNEFNKSGFYGEYGQEKKEKAQAPNRRGRPRVRPVKIPGEKKKLGRPRDETNWNVICDICGKFFKRIALLRQHEKIHWGIKEFECDYCHKRFLKKGALTIHLLIHTGEKPHKCPYCPESFRVQNMLTAHVFKHTKQGVKCPQCPLVFATQTIVKVHVLRVHTTEKPYVCQICGDSYKHRQSLAVHLKDHDKRVCTVCGKMFSSVNALAKHQQHTHRVVPRCSYCNRCFKSEEELQAHTKLRGRVHQCKMCCFSFNKAEFLDNHYRRDHWKEMGLERLPRTNLGMPRKRKPKTKIVQITNQTVVVDSSQNPCLPSHSIFPAPSIMDSNQLELQLVDQSCSPVPMESTVISVLTATVQTNNESATSKALTEHKVKTEENILAESNYDQDFSTYHEDVDDYNSDQDKDEMVKLEDKPQIQCEDLAAAPTLELFDFVKVENIETYKPEENQKEDAPQLKEDLMESKSEELKMKMEPSSDSEDDEVPLAALRLIPRHTVTPICAKRKDKIDFNCKKKQRPKVNKDSSADDLNEKDHIETENSKPKRRRRKHDGKGPRKRFRPKRDLACPICGDVCKGRTALKEHRKSAHLDARAKAGPVICEICGKSYKTENCLIVHRGKHEEYQRFKCDECLKAFVYRYQLENHTRTEHRQERHICPLCGKQFKHSMDLKYHSLLHEEEKPFKCKQCPAAFRQHCSLQRHKGVVHDKVVLTCTICDKSFGYETSLRLHKRIHSKDFFRCEICEREFSQKTSMTRHMKIHSIDRQVKCVVCDKIYYKKVELLIHQAKEHPNDPLIGKTIKVHTCKVCGMEFTKESHLKMHSDIHENEYKFKCDMCEDQKFKQKAGLRYHWQHFHKIEPPKRNLGKISKEKIDKVANTAVSFEQNRTLNE